MSNERLEWINKRAYQLWDENGRPDGQDQSNWEQANREFDAMQAPAVNTPPPTAEEPVATPAKVVKPRASPKKASVSTEPGAVVKKPRAKPATPKV